MKEIILHFHVFEMHSIFSMYFVLKKNLKSPIVELQVAPKYGLESKISITFFMLYIVHIKYISCIDR